MPSIEAVAANIRAERARTGMSRSDLAELLGVTAQTIGSYERGESVPSLSAAAAMAKVFGCTVDSLVRDT